MSTSTPARARPLISSPLPAYVIHGGIPGFGYDLVHASNDPIEARAKWESQRVPAGQTLLLRVGGTLAAKKTEEGEQRTVPGDLFDLSGPAAAGSVASVCLQAERRRVRPR